jgi:hypothetical protein
MIKLKSLINEQKGEFLGEFYYPPETGNAPAAGAPVPMSAPATPTADPSAEEQPPTPETDTTPEPEDPNEYDWTKDFRAFEDAKNKAESVAKKKLLDKMNKSIVGKKISTNASRGYGQPKTDHTIEKVKKVSVEFWYKEWVVIIQDENDKKYFLTPGVNIKIEQGAEGGDQTNQVPTEPEAGQTGSPGEEESPNAAQPEPGAEVPGAEMSPAIPGADVGTAPADPMAQQPAAQPAAVPQPPVEQPPVVPPKKKKKLAEEINKNLKSFLSEYMIDENTDFTQYIKGIKSAINESRGASVYKARLEIPINHMKSNIDVRDIQLSAKETMWESGNIGQKFSRGSINISKVGRVYLMEYIKENGWK